MQVELAPIDPTDPEARALNAALSREADVRAGVERPPPLTISDDLNPPRGLLLAARAGEELAGLGGVRHLDTEVAEIKSMYVPPRWRGAGIGRRLLEVLEGVARDHGCRAVRLDTSRELAEAIGLYRSAGYTEVGDYNGNALADMWFERSLKD
jgi:GNAT superfamily N-acetyltransferase